MDTKVVYSRMVQPSKMLYVDDVLGFINRIR